MSAFELATAGRVLFGAGVQRQLAAAVAATGARAVLLVTGASPARAAIARGGLAGSGAGGDDVPDRRRADAGGGSRRRRAGPGRAGRRRGGGRRGGRRQRAGRGQGDRGAGRQPRGRARLPGGGRARAARCERPPLPFFAVPTTAGTGSEVTRNAVLTVPDARLKASLRSPLMLPRVAAVDPDLLGGLPPAVVASSGLDALSQVIEPFLSIRANPLTDALARDGIGRSARALRRAYAGELARDAGLREDLALASLTGGLCLANAGLGAVHGFAAPAGGMFGAPHGAVCAALLPHVLDVNLRALRARAPAAPGAAALSRAGGAVDGRAGGRRDGRGRRRVRGRADPGSGRPRAGEPRHARRRHPGPGRRRPRRRAA